MTVQRRGGQALWRPELRVKSKLAIQMAPRARKAVTARASGRLPLDSCGTATSTGGAASVEDDAGRVLWAGSTRVGATTPSPAARVSAACCGPPAPDTLLSGTDTLLSCSTSTLLSSGAAGLSVEVRGATS